MSKTTKEEILEKAITLFIKNGYEPTSLSDIAKSVGIQKASLFSRFASKEAIFREAVDYYILHQQLPQQKFGDYEGMSMKQFIEHYIGCINKCNLNYRNKIGKELDVFPCHFFSFIMEVSLFDSKYNTILDVTNEAECEIWENVINYAKEIGEVKKEIDTKQIAECIRYSVLGISYSKAPKGGAMVNELRTLLNSIYNLIKV